MGPASRLSPILVKEMRSTMRGTRTFVGITLFLLFLAGFSLLVYYIVAGNGGPPRNEGGRLLFGMLAVVEALMLAIVVPPLTASAIAGERQRQTFDMLMATPLSPAQVLAGKLLASMNYLFLLIFASLPINSIAFLLGGVSPSALFWWVALVVAVLLLLGTLGLMMSTLFKSGGVATSLTYLLCALIFGLVPFCALIFGMMGLDTRGSGLHGLLLVALLHPASSLAAILVNETEFHAAMLLPATVPLYLALSGVIFLVAEARLRAILGQPGRRPLLLGLLLLVIGAAVAYLALGPVQAIATGM